MKKLICTILIGSLLLTAAHNVNAQENARRIISISELVSQLNNCKEESFDLFDCKIEVSLPQDSIYIKKFYNSDSSYSGRRTIIKDIDFSHLELVAFHNCDLGRLSFVNCKFKNLNFYTCNLWLNANSSIFRILYLYKCDATGIVLFDSEITEAVIITTSTLKTANFHNVTFSNLAPQIEPYLLDFHLGIEFSTVENIRIDECTFAVIPNQPEYFHNLTVEETAVTQMFLENFQVQSLNLESSTVLKSFEADKITISEAISLKYFDYPFQNTNLPWESIAGEKISLVINDSVNYQAKSEEQLHQELNYNDLISTYNKLLTYFRSEQRLEDFYTEQHKEEFQSYAEFKENLQESKIEVPLFINLLGKPLYQLSLIQHEVKQWLYRRSEILSGKWMDLGKGRRIYVSMITGISVLFYIVYLISIRSVNSLFLSINTFSTLGFGDILVKGISRYMAILEGFLGWFLLSIFSVSLISQILQN